MARPDTNQLAAQAKSAYRAGRFVEAREACERLLKEERKNLVALEILGRIALRRGAIEEALQRFRACATLRPREPDYQYLVGLALFDLGRTDEAIRKYDAVLRSKPDMELVVQSKATALERRGDHEAARAALEPLLAASGEKPSVVALRARLEMAAGRFPEAIDLIRRRLEAGDLPPRERQGLLFDLSKACDKVGDYDAAFTAAAEANAVDEPDFDRAAYRARVDRLIEVFSADSIGSLARAASRSERPVIIAGMPRSGTTLIEQIVDAHPKARGAGELGFLPELIERIQMDLDSYEPYPDCLEDMTGPAAERFAGAYLNHLRSFSRHAARIVDKTLDNFEHLGLMALICPAARVIATRREPMDTCLSCFLNPILAERFPWISDLGDLGFVYRQHERLMDHWRGVLDLPILDVDYPRMVDEQETMTRRIIDFVGLEFNDRCLQFHRSGRTVMTLSYDQVSRPIYRSSLARWRNYEKHLAPLREALEEESDQATRRPGD